MGSGESARDCGGIWGWGWSRTVRTAAARPCRLPDGRGSYAVGMGCKLTAFEVSSTANWVIEPASGKRDWMDATPEKFAYRCLPLVMANQAGWVLRCPLNFTAKWNGGTRGADTVLTFPEGEGPNAGQVRSHFGSGIVTFSMPWLFRTSAGYGLWVRGPSNAPKDHVVALDGIVETDWNPASFTMNWKIMRRNTEVYFREGEPIALLVPFPLAMLEEVEPEFKTLDDDPQLKQDFYTFTAQRSGNLEKIGAGGKGTWAMDYMRGHLPDGTAVNEHRKAFKLARFPGT